MLDDGRVTELRWAWPAWLGYREALIYQLIFKEFNYLGSVTASKLTGF